MYYVYLVECSDHTFYIGFTTDVQKRIYAHNMSNTGAKYTKTRRPVTLRYTESFETKSEALKREYALKQLTRAQKEALISLTSA